MEYALFARHKEFDQALRTVPGPVSKVEITFEAHGLSRPSETSPDSMRGYARDCKRLGVNPLSRSRLKFDSHRGLFLPDGMSLSFEGREPPKGCDELAEAVIAGYTGGGKDHKIEIIGALGPPYYDSGLTNEEFRHFVGTPVGPSQSAATMLDRLERDGYEISHFQMDLAHTEPRYWPTRTDHSYPCISLSGWGPNNRDPNGRLTLSVNARLIDSEKNRTRKDTLVEWFHSLENKVSSDQFVLGQIQRA